MEVISTLMRHDLICAALRSNKTALQTLCWSNLWRFNFQGSSVCVVSKAPESGKKATGLTDLQDLAGLGSSPSKSGTISNCSHPRLPRDSNFKLEQSSPDSKRSDAYQPCGFRIYVLSFKERKSHQLPVLYLGPLEYLPESIN
jgi:hypothetical protein